MINRLLYKLTAGLPVRLISLESGPYLERYYLGKVLGVTFYLHRFVSADSERHVHNHPWKWGGSVILAGGYTEERLVDLCPHAEGGYLTRFIKRRWFNVVNGNTFHRIHDAKPGTWTLFFHGARELVWVPSGKPVGSPGMQLGFKEKAPKGWGFLERDGAYVNGQGTVDVTAFYSYPSAHSNWWETAPTGQESQRVSI